MAPSLPSVLGEWSARGPHAEADCFRVVRILRSSVLLCIPFERVPPPGVRKSWQVPTESRGRSHILLGLSDSGRRAGPSNGIILVRTSLYGKTG